MGGDERFIKYTRRVSLRLVEVRDASFICILRQNESRNKYISQVSSSIETQRQWIEKYKFREVEKQEFYFVIHTEHGDEVGLVRVYDFQEDSFCWGSWIIQEGAPQYVAIESALSIYEFAFHELGFLRSHFDVRKENQRVINFHKRFGAVFEREEGDDLYFSLARDAYERTKLKYRKFF